MPNPIVDPLVDGHDESLDTPDVEVDVTPEGVATVLINRPDRQNTLDWNVIEALSEAFETLHAADGVRVVLLRGAGGAFCAGADPQWLMAGTDDAKDEEDAVVEEVGKMLRRLWRMPALTVALVDGVALGAGAWLASACDVVVADQAASFGYVDAKLRATSAVISPYVAGAMGFREVEDLFAKDRTYGAGEAQRLGLVQEVVADRAALDAIAERIAASAGGEPAKDGLTQETLGRIAGAQAEAEDLGGARPDWADQ